MCRKCLRGAHKLPDAVAGENELRQEVVCRRQRELVVLFNLPVRIKKRFKRSTKGLQTLTGAKELNGIAKLRGVSATRGHCFPATFKASKRLCYQLPVP